MTANQALRCAGCGSELLDPSLSELCGFCEGTEWVYEEDEDYAWTHWTSGPRVESPITNALYEQLRTWDGQLASGAVLLGDCAGTGLSDEDVSGMHMISLDRMGREVQAELKWYNPRTS